MNDEMNSHSTSVAAAGESLAPEPEAAPVDVVATAPVDELAAAEAEAPDEIAVAIAAAEARLADPTLTPAGFLLAMFDRARPLAALVHPSRRVEAAKLVDDAANLAVEAQRIWLQNLFAHLPGINARLR
ncbi:MAG: hypothetical protein ACREPW_11340, partial [Candidatus Binataceae bacterium]